MSKCPTPSTKGVYNPRGIRRVEKLIPGAITLRARQKPQNKYQKKLGFTSSDVIWRPMSRAKITHIQTSRDIKEPLLRPFSPASRNREGSIPVIRPIKTQTEGSGYFSRKKDKILATPRKPITPPMKTGISFGTCVLKFL